MSVLCSMVGASFTVAAVAQILRSKKAITAVGNAQVSTAQSQFGGASALFDGNGDYLAVTNIASGITADQTFEFWIRFADLPGAGGFRMVAGDGGGEKYMGLLNDSGTYRWEVSFSSGQYVERFTASVATNTWYHVALTKSASTLRVYQGGTQLTSAVSFNTMSAEKTLFVSGTNYIGSWNTSSNFLNGWMDEIRISNNVRYIANFTPSTTPFVNDANTVLLIHANGTTGSTFFEDDNGVRASLTPFAIGNAQISTAQSQFGATSALFDGTGDYLEIPYQSSLGINSGNFTIEFWYYHPQTGINGTFGDSLMGQMSSGANGGWVIRAFANKLTWVWDNISGYDVATFDPLANTWYHVAFVRSGTGMTCYVNGTSYAVTGFANNTNVSTLPIRIGKAYIGQDDDYNGYIDEVRISNTARYTAGFTPSTVPFTNDANTVLLLHMDGTNGSTVFRDDNGQGRSSRGIIANGNAQVSTAQSQFGGTSALFDGTGDFLSTTSVAWHSQSTGTIEYWFRHNTTVPFGQGHIGQFTQGSANGWQMGTFNNKLNWFDSATNFEVAYDFALSANTWYHVAIVKESSSVLKIYVDGTLRYTKSLGAFTDSTGNLSIGRVAGVSSSLYDSVRYDLNGYLDEIRISNTARYTAAFTPSTAPFQNDANTVLLIHADGTNASTVFVDDNGIAPYTP